MHDPDLFSNPSQLTSKEILTRCVVCFGTGWSRADGRRRRAENYVRYNKTSRQQQATRGEVHPHRPDLRQGYSAPQVGRPPGGHLGGNGPSRMNERPTSMSTYVPNAAQLSPRDQQPRPMRPNLSNQQSRSFNSGVLSSGHPYAPQPPPDFRRPTTADGPRREGPNDGRLPVAVQR